MVRWAAVESVQRLPKTSRLGAFRDQVAARRGRNIGIVAAARRRSSWSTTRCATTTSARSTPPGARPVPTA